MSFKCLIVDEMHPSISGMLNDIKIEVNYRPDISRAEIIKSLGEYQGLIIRSKTRVDAELCRNAVNLKFVARAGAGIDKLDVDFLKKKGIAVINAPEGNRDAVGDHTIGLILSLLNKIHLSWDEVRNFEWHREKNRGSELNSKTVGLFGFGNTGRAVAKRLKAFGCEIITYDKYVTTIDSSLAKKVSLQELLANADILSFHIPLTEETGGLVTSSFLKNCKKHLIIINTSRGEIFPVTEILDSFEKGYLAGIGLDVLEKEKFDQLEENERNIYSKLFRMDNVIVTPHIAGWTQESYVRINEVLVKKISDLVMSSH